MSQTLRVYCLIGAALVTGACTESPTASSPIPPADATFTVSGIVRDNTQQPVAGASVEVVSGPLFGAVTSTDAQGRFGFDSPIPTATSVTLRVSKDGFQAATGFGVHLRTLIVTLFPTTFPDVSGVFTATFRAADTCTSLPADLRVRTYMATIRTANGPASFTSSLSGASFQSGYSTFFGNIGSDNLRLYISSWDAFNWWLEDQPIIEQLPSGGHLSIIGVGNATIGSPSFGGSVNGNWSYCERSAPPGGQNWPLTCAVPMTICSSDAHRVTLAR